MIIKQRLKKIVFVGAVWICACGGAVEQVHETDIAAEMGPAPSASSDAPAAIEEGGAPVVSVSRAELVAIVENGPAMLLAMVQNEPVLENGRFVGFRIVAFRTEAQQILGLAPGDVLTRVNGQSIERPEYFIKVFNGLSTATEISFDIIRDGSAKTLKTSVQP